MALRRRYVDVTDRYLEREFSSDFTTGECFSLPQGRLGCPFDASVVDAYRLVWAPRQISHLVITNHKV